jgi:predicted RNA-binding Zn ribbon-like protein
MSWVATERFQARPAPAGLALVQELVNTHAVYRGGPDLLADLPSARRWLAAAARQWAAVEGLAAPETALSEPGVATLREVRAALEEMLAVPADERPEGPPAGAVRTRAPAELLRDGEGRVGIVPIGTGAGWLESAVWSEVLLAQRSGTWSRLKLCREPGCRSAFYDTSRNHSGVWHNVRSCGNITNLRASRTRRKQQVTAADGKPAER